MPTHHQLLVDNIDMSIANHYIRHLLPKIRVALRWKIIQKMIRGAHLSESQLMAMSFFPHVIKLNAWVLMGGHLKNAKHTL
jgi:hypothetical protein